MAEHRAWARETAACLLEPLGRRWAHTVGVVQRAHGFSGVLSASDFEALVSAACLHDVGYADGLSETGFHPLDGAMFLRAFGFERLACLVAHHSSACTEAEERRLLAELEPFAEERSLVADALTYCDLTTDALGAPTSVSARIADIRARYCARDPVGRAIRQSGHELLGRSRAVERVLTSRSRGRSRVR